LAKELGLSSDRVIDIFEVMGGSSLSSYVYFFDKYHPNTLGYNAMAQHIWKVVDFNSIYNQKYLVKEEE